MKVATLLVLVLLCVGVYCGLFLLGNLYSESRRWQPPAGTEATNWTLRRNLAFVLGLIASVLCAAGSWFWLTDPVAQLVASAEGVLLAAAGASDLRRFHLPLPFTMSGIAIAIGVAIAMRVPLFIVLFGLGWGLALILLHAVVSKGSMQLGDHIATLWIALVLPFNGMLALLIGDLANVILARIQGLKGKKVAAAGAWLIVCAALIGTPPYVTWMGTAVSSQSGHDPAGEPCNFEEAILESECSVAALTNRADAITVGGATSVSTMRWKMQTTETLITLSEWAGDTTAHVVLAEAGAARTAAARQASLIIDRYAALAHVITQGQDSEVAAALDALSAALYDYDVDGVGSASRRLLAERERLTALLSGNIVEFRATR